MTALTIKMALPSPVVPEVLPQLVPSSACLRCDVCCRFPDPDSPLRPFFTGEEISRAVDHGLETKVFHDRSGCQITVVPDTQGEGFVCPPLKVRAVPVASTTSARSTASSIHWP